LVESAHKTPVCAQQIPVDREINANPNVISHIKLRFPLTKFRSGSPLRIDL
jgi:hypothetical protein